MERIDAPIPVLKGVADRAYGIFPYAGPPGDAVRRLKFSRRTGLSDWMAREIAEAYSRLQFDAELVVAVPIHWRRRDYRGFNQSEAIASKLPIPARHDALRRLRHTPQQTKLTPERRLRNLEGAFRAAGVDGRRVLLVDDVTTSGATAKECIQALRLARAKHVSFLAFATSLTPGAPGETSSG